MTTPKNTAYDGKGAVAGEGQTLPDNNTVEALDDRAGLDLSPGEPIAVKETLEKRDEERWELDPDSAQSPAEGSKML